MEESFENLLQVLYEYGEAVRDIYKDRLLADGKRATGKLIKNVQAFVAYEGTEAVVYLQLEDYWKYVENGRKPGRWPPRQKILDWIRIKPILPRPNENGKLPTQEQLAFLIQRKIGTKGIPAGNQLKETIESINNQYLPLLQEALERDFTAYALSVYGDINKMIRI